MTTVKSWAEWFELYLSLSLSLSLMTSPSLFRAQGDLNKDGSEVDSEEENEEGDYTVFECPGLAPVSDP